MDVFEKSLFALDNFFANSKEEEIQKILDEVNELCFEGPSIEDFFLTLYKTKPIRFKFQEGVEPYPEIKSPPMGFKALDETPKYPLESFFFVTSHYVRNISCSI